MAKAARNSLNLDIKNMLIKSIQRGDIMFALAIILILVVLFIPNTNCMCSGKLSETFAWYEPACSTVIVNHITDTNDCLCTN